MQLSDYKGIIYISVDKFLRNEIVTLSLDRDLQE